MGFEGSGADGLRLAETTGLPRLLEGLQSVEWDADADADADLDIDELLELTADAEEEEEGSALDVFTAYEDGGMREPIVSADAEDVADTKTGDRAEEAGGSWLEGLGGGGLHSQEEKEKEEEGDMEVQALQRMVLKMQAVKEIGAALPAGERRRVAARAVREVMRGV